MPVVGEEPDEPEEPEPAIDDEEPEEAEDPVEDEEGETNSPEPAQKKILSLRLQ